MKFPISLISTFILSASWGNSLVITKMDMNSFISYYQKEIMKHNMDTIKDLFSKKDLFKYCDLLRQAKVYQEVTTSEEFPDYPTVFPIYVLKETLEIEKDQVQMQLFNFRLGNSKHTVSFWGFPCMNYNDNRSWIVSPAFVPESAVLDSAFLFEFELNYRQLTQREINGETEVIAHSAAFVDQNGKISERNRLRILLKFREELDQKDPLCDLDLVLKYRLCSIALNSEDDHYPGISNIITDNSTTRQHVIKVFSQYFNPENSDDGCEPLEIPFMIGSTESSSAKRKMLLCPANKYDRKRQFYIGLDPFDPTKLFCINKSVNFLTKRPFTHIWNLKLPLLTHLNISHYIKSRNN